MALYEFVNFLLTYWFIREVFPTPESPSIITLKSFLLLEVGLLAEDDIFFVLQISMESIVILSGLVGLAVWIFSPSSRNPPGSPATLYNTGNTCYYNSVLQCLSAFQSLQDSSEILHQLATLKDTTLYPPPSPLPRYAQQDAHEAFCQLTKNSTQFSGLTASSVYCNACKYASTCSLFTNTCTSLAITGDSLYQLLESFATPEVLENCYLCDKCSLISHANEINGKIQKLKLISQSAKSELNEKFNARIQELTTEYTKIMSWIRHDVDAISVSSTVINSRSE